MIRPVLIGAVLIVAANAASAQTSAPKPKRVAQNAAATTNAPQTPAPEPDTAATPPSILREAYSYSRDGRRDPFFSLLSTEELRPALSDLKLVGVLVDPSGKHSIATLRDLGTSAQYRVTTGATLGRMRVARIKIGSVVFTIDEFGTTRQDSLVLRDTTKVRP